MRRFAAPAGRSAPGRRSSAGRQHPTHRGGPQPRRRPARRRNDRGRCRRLHRCSPGRSHAPRTPSSITAAVRTTIAATAGRVASGHISCPRSVSPDANEGRISTGRILPRTARYDNLTFQAPMSSSARTPERIDDSQTNRLSPIATRQARRHQQLLDGGERRAPHLMKQVDRRRPAEQHDRSR